MKRILQQSLLALGVMSSFAAAAQAPASPALGPIARPSGTSMPGSLAKVDDTIGSAKEAIASTTISVNGKALPLLPLVEAGSAARTSGSASCELGDTQSFTGVAAIDLESADRQPSSYYFPPTPMVAIYSSPNSDWVIESYQRVVTTAGAPYQASDSAVPGGYSFLSAGNYSAVSSTMHSYVGSLNIPNQVKIDLNAQLSSMISNISSYGYSLSASHASIVHTAQVQGTGRFNVNTAHSWYHAFFKGVLGCKPLYLSDQGALEARLKAWVDLVVRKMHSSKLAAEPMGQMID